jgi:hypothetical protein
MQFELPDERHEFELCYHGVDMRCALSEFREWMRQQRKTDAWSNELEVVWERYHEILLDRNIV